MSTSATLEAAESIRFKDEKLMGAHLRLADTTLIRYRNAVAALADRQQSLGDASNSLAEKRDIYCLMMVNLGYIPDIVQPSVACCKLKMLDILLAIQACISRHYFHRQVMRSCSGCQRQ